MTNKLTRREALEISGLALGGLALGSVLPGCGSNAPETTDNTNPTNTNSLIDGLQPYYPGKEKLGKDEMRITFLGTSVVPRLAQECNSVFVE